MGFPSRHPPSLQLEFYLPWTRFQKDIVRAYSAPKVITASEISRFRDTASGRRWPLKELHKVHFPFIAELYVPLWVRSCYTW